MDDFIGTTFNDGKLVVTGIAGRDKQGHKEYSCHCSKCAKDPELFGDAVFRSTKSSLVRGVLPCGCSKKPKWSTAQYRVLISRKAAGRYTAVVPDGIKNKTKVQCTCNADGCGHVWETEIYNLLNAGSGCRKCAGSLPITENEAIEKVQAICSEKNWNFLGFEDGWKNNRSRLLLECSCGHTWSPTYTDVVNCGSGCVSCAGRGYNPSLPGWFYTYLWERKETKAQCLKYGISNNPKQRIQIQRRRNSSFTAKQLCSIPFADGSIPPAIEKAIDDHKRNNNIPNQVTKDLFPDGFSETLPIEEWSFIANLIQNETMCRLTPL